MRLALTLVLGLGLIAACGGEDEFIPRDAQSTPVTPDAPVAIDAVEVERGVRCGPSMTLCDPTSTQGCCTTPPAEPACEPGGGLCLGQLVSCDGREDCDPGDVCCDFGFGAGCGASNDCVAEFGGTVVCHADGDCTTATPRCCDGTCAAACGAGR